MDLIDDSSVELENNLKSLTAAVLTGIAAAVIVLAFFYRNFKTSIIIIISLPVSLSIVFIYMYFF